ncbi:MAG: DNA translocase FtsK 4TM domain-containing protein, partial [Bacteroidales bacterium]|nr:DNA translocase FtsK 4TM domain-containing protein [Bacteroidales bacterium]
MSKGSKEKADKGKFYRLTHDERFKMTLAFVFIGLAVFVIVAFVSYLFTWKADQSMAEFSRVSDQHTSHADNWMGKLGAWTAFKLITNGFGLSSFFIPLIFLVLGFRLLKVKLLPLLWTLRTSLIGLALLSLIFGFVSGNTGGFLGTGLGGAHGIVMSDWFVSLLGRFGTAILLLLLTFAFLTFTFVGFFSWFKRTSSSVYDSVTKAKLPKLPKTVKPAKTYPTPSSTTEDNENEEDNDDDDESQDDEIIPSGEKTEGEISFEIVKPNREDDEPLTEPPSTNDEPEQYVMDPLDAMGPYDPTLELSNYEKPSLDLLIDRQSDENSVTADELENNKNKIVDTLGNYGIQISKIKATPGPTVTLYEIVPAAGVRISKIKNLEDDIALSLSALGIRIIAPMPGKGTIGIEVPNMNPEIVSMRSIVASKRFQESAM